MLQEKKVWYLLCVGFTSAIFSVLVALALVVANQLEQAKVVPGVIVPTSLAAVFLTIAHHEMNKPKQSTEEIQ